MKQMRNALPYMIVGLMRGKENNKKKKVIRHVCNGEVQAGIEHMRNLIEAQALDGEVWRIYRSVNRRDVVKANRALLDVLIDNRGINAMETWLSLLMKVQSRHDKNILLDCDGYTREDVEAARVWLAEENIQLLDVVETPNGYHIVIPPTDYRVLYPLPPGMGIKPDDLLYVETV